jgi:hypothetical protein
MQPATAIPTRHDPSPTRRYSLDDLMRYSYAELEAMYRAAPAPTTLRAADGVLVGRMLAWRGQRGLATRLLQRIALSPSFVWQGKTLSSHDDRTGTGYNRVNLGGFLGRQHIFHFDSRIASSLHDGRPTIVIDYDRPANPWWMRHVHDEIRMLEPGLFLGLDLWRSSTRSTGLVWFALDGRPSRSAA